MTPFIIEGHKVLDLLGFSGVPTTVPAPVRVHQRLSVPEFECVYGLWRRGVEKQAKGLFCILCGFVGKGSPCDSIVCVCVCVCLPCQRLAEQWLGWLVLRGALAVERGRVRGFLRKGRGPAPSTTTTTGLAGRAAADAKPQERGSEAWWEGVL